MFTMFAIDLFTKLSLQNSLLNSRLVLQNGLKYFLAHYYLQRLCVCKYVRPFFFNKPQLIVDSSRNV